MPDAEISILRDGAVYIKDADGEYVFLIDPDEKKFVPAGDEYIQYYTQMIEQLRIHIQDQKDEIQRLKTYVREDKDKEEDIIR